jgi:hypothetical protein
VSGSLWGETAEMHPTKLPEVSTNAAARRAKPAEQSINRVQSESFKDVFQLGLNWFLVCDCSSANGCACSHREVNIDIQLR